MPQTNHRASWYYIIMSVERDEEPKHFDTSIFTTHEKAEEHHKHAVRVCNKLNGLSSTLYFISDISRIPCYAIIKQLG